MSKSRSTSEASDTKKKTNAQIIMERSIAAAKKAATSKGIIAIALLLISVFALHASHLMHASEAVLYLFANNGKLSGRMDGDVKMRNGRSRGFTVPALVRNAYTARVRSLFAGLSSSFRSLTPDQIAGWNAANSFNFVDRFAQSHVLKGKQLYISLNSNLTLAGGTVISDCPVPTGVLPVPDQTLTASTGGGDAFTVGSSDTTVAVDTAVLVSATPMLSAGVSRPSQSQFRHIATITAGAGAFPALLIAQYGVKFGGLVVGAKVFVQTKVINTVTGEASAIAESVAIVS